MHLFKQYFPAKKQFLVTTQIGQKALKNQNFIDEVFVFEKNKITFAKFVQFSRNVSQKVKENVNEPIILQPHLSYRSSLLALLLKMPRVTYFETNLGFGAHKVSRLGVLHEAQRIGLLLEPLGVKRKDIISAKPILKSRPLREDFPYHHTIVDRTKKIIAVAPGSVWPTKRWDIKKFGELMQNILAHTEHHLVLLGSKNEEPLADALPDSVVTSERFINLMGKTTLEDLPALYPHFAVLVSNDSSPIHYASSFDIPTIAIFQATTSQMGFAPMATKQVVLENTSLACRPCGLHGHQHCPLGHFECMQSIKPQDVFKVLMTLIYKHYD